MTWNWVAAAEAATEALALLAPQATVIGGPDHIAGAQAALQTAGQVASTLITDPAQQQQMIGAYTAASAILSLLSLFHKSTNTGLGSTVAPPAK